MEEQKEDSGCKTLGKFMFSHIGSCVLVVLYCIMGGFLFEHLEKDNEIQICYDKRSDYQKMANKSFSEIIDVLKDDSNTSVKFNEIEGIMTTFRDNSVGIGYTGDNCSSYGKPGGPKHEWTWAGSFFFSVTVISTIGYGHIAPKTSWGRLACIAYAVLGIPLVMVCLATIGDSLADMIRFLYFKICCCGFCRKDKTKVDSQSSTPVPNEPKNNEKNNISTIPREKALFDMEKRPGAPPLSSRPATPSTVRILPLDVWHFKTNSKVVPSPAIQRRTVESNETKNVRKEPELMHEPIDDDDIEIDDDLHDISVPLTVTMLIVALYIIGGAFLFGLWEKWDLLQSSYFCFITLSTIGFGDVTPGTDFDSPRAQIELLLGAMYMLFGLSILSMAFSLIHEEIVTKFRWLGSKLGLVDEEDVI